MSNVKKRPFSQVLPIAQALMQKLSPVCERIEIVGSLRRKEKMIGDIDFILVPSRKLNMFGEATGDYHLDDLLAGWGSAIELGKGGLKSKDFSFWSTNTVTCKRIQHHVNLFIQPDPQTWGVNMMIRTGSADFSRRMVLKKKYKGLMPDDLSMAHARVFKHGKMLNTPEEGDVFKLWGMVYVKPEDRA